VIISEERKQFRSVLRDFCQEKITAEYLRNRIYNKTATDFRPTDSNLWQSLLDLGLFELVSSEGLAIDLAIIAQEVGASLLPENLMSSLLVNAYLIPKLSKQDSDSLKQFLSKSGFIYEDIVNGKIQSCIIDLDNVNQGSSIQGLVPYAGSSRLCLFRHQDLSSKANLLAIASLMPNSTNIAQKNIAQKVIDGLDLLYFTGEIAIDNAEICLCPSLDLDRTKLLLMTLHANEIAGVCRHVVKITTEYVKTRTQFNMPIGSFQAVQHKLADMHSQTEALRSLAEFAAWTVDNSPDQTELASRSAIIFAIDTAPKILENTIQLHGGIGFTWEHEAHLYLRRVKYLEACYSNIKAEAESLIRAAI
jgi:Acyl-CoA dehydrogenase, C-terminal domain